jgi:uncharacterized RDD family membrane protein YckC
LQTSSVNWNTMKAPASESAMSAPLWLRLVAGAYDLLPLLGLWFAAGVLAFAVTGGALDPHRLAHKLLVQALVLGLSAAYFVVSWTRGGQTIGMRAWRLRVVRADGTTLSLWRALLRFFIALISFAALGIGFWWALVEHRRRTWHDIAAGTVVLRKPK